MSDTNKQMPAEWNELVENMNNAVAQSMEQNMEASAAFMESWADAMEDSVPDEEALSSGVEGYSDAYEVWMNAAEEMSGRTTAAAEGEDVDMTEFRDIWLQSANEAFKEVMGTSAFAAANGQLVNSMMEMREEVDAMGEDTLEQLGMPTQSDIDEVGERIIELERRQHSVEKKLDRIIKALE
ncbi:MAG: hypothetical protein ACI9TI_001443 [Natronomonas sp.]|jgi:hypothetical protein|uniref:poly(R)-hydroxyalkanoic acid synthase subunit PhaE n=1 Tax=Natronomonas sp. TaxID=2184060 RepID=UPI00398A0F33